MHALKIALGFLLDLLFGDPYNFPHPVKFIGKFITGLERLLIRLKNQRFAGIILTLIVIVTTFIITILISSISVSLEILLIYTTFATKSLATEAKGIYNSLNENSIESARARLGLLVSRDTGDLEECDIIRGTVETVSENIVDGIISPMFFLFLGGVPLAMIYKAINTLDSMVGYKSERYKNFGWASARLDDILNFIPARITAFLLLPLSALMCRKSIGNTIRVVIRDRHNHSSPNAGHSEAAVAGALGIRLGGPGKYFGEVVDKPYIGDRLREISRKDILESIRLLYSSSIIGLIMGTGIITIWQLVTSQ